MMGFFVHLWVRNSILDFMSDVEFQLRRGHCLLAVFLDIKQGLKRVRVDVIIIIIPCIA